MSKIIYGIFDDDTVLLKAIKSLRDQGIKITDVITPFPVHGIEKALGMKSTRMAIVSFLFGATGTCLAILMMWYMNIFDWPMNIGGKPSFALYKNIPAFIPITFEVTVLLAAHGMAITFFLRSWILPGVQPKVPDLRMTDDHFVMQLNADDNNESMLSNALRQVGAIEVKSE